MKELGVIILYWVSFYIFSLLTSALAAMSSSLLFPTDEIQFWLGIAAKYVLPLLSLICAVFVWAVEIVLEYEGDWKCK